MSIKASEISDLIKARIEKFAGSTEERNVGTVVTVTDGIVRIHGLADVKYGEMLEFPGGSFGLALNLEQDSVGSVVLGEYKHITEGDTVKTTGRILEVPVGEALLGRVVDALGLPIDGKLHGFERTDAPGGESCGFDAEAGIDVGKFFREIVGELVGLFLVLVVDLLEVLFELHGIDLFGALLGEAVRGNADVLDNAGAAGWHAQRGVLHVRGFLTEDGTQ